MREFNGWHHREQREYTRIQTSVQRSAAIDKRRQGYEALHVHTLDFVKQAILTISELYDCISATFLSFYEKENIVRASRSSVWRNRLVSATTIRSEITHEFRGLGHSSVPSQNMCKKRERERESATSLRRSNFPPETFDCLRPFRTFQTRAKCSVHNVPYEKKKKKKKESICARRSQSGN